jgi:hypothetical protein
MADVPNTLPGGSTNTVEGIYRSWDELRSVPSGQQSSLRIIVLFTDGASNSVDANYAAGVLSLRTYDFPKNFPDPDSQTWDYPSIVGLFDPQSGVQNPAYPALAVDAIHGQESTQTLPQVTLLPVTTSHQHHRSGGIPTSFPLQTSSLTVNGAAQNSVRGLRNLTGGQYPADVFNINNAARNVLEIIADQARNDAGGDYRIRIYTIGMSFLVQYMLGTMPEKPEDILKRVANDTISPDYNATQLQGKYYYAPTAADVGPAFEGIQNQIIRLTQ